MKKIDFFDSETTRKAYLGKHAFDFINLATEQASELYEEFGLIIPMEVSSSLQYLQQNGPLTVADIAKALSLPHQLATQRIEKLIKLELVRRKPDPTDGRRSLLNLTKKGSHQAKLLESCMEDIAQRYQDLFDEIGCDLANMISSATEALRRRPMQERAGKRKSKPAK